MPYNQLSCACNCARREVLRAGSILSVLCDMHGLAWQPLILGQIDTPPGPQRPFTACRRGREDFSSPLPRMIPSLPVLVSNAELQDS